MAAAKKREPWPMGERIREAINASRWTQTSFEAELIRTGFMASRGQLSSLISGRRGKHTTSLETLGKIADLLGVSFEWVARGVGGMRDGVVTPKEAARQFAVVMGAREDAIQGAFDRHADREGMDADAWLDAIKLEMKARAGSLRPEDAHTARAAVQRTKRKKAIAEERAKKAVVSDEKDDHGTGRVRHRAG